MIEPEQIVQMFQERKVSRGQWWDKADEVRRHYNGEIMVPLPELDDIEKPATANLLAMGVEQFAMRIASVAPEIQFPSLKPGFKGWDTKAHDSRLAVKGWWQMNQYKIKMRRRARFLVAYGCAPVTITPVAPDGRDARKIPFVRVRNPLSAYPSQLLDADSLEPSNCIFHDQKPLAWLKDTYPAQASLIYKGEKFNDTTLFDILEYVDEDETVIICVGSSRNPGTRYEPTGGTASMALLERIPNRAGISPVVFPGRVTLDRLAGQFDGTIGMHLRAAKLDALNTIAIFRGVFPEQWVEGNNQARAPQILQYADGKQGQVGIVKDGRVTQMLPQVGQMGMQLLDQLERNQRLSAGIPAEFGGESPTNVRTARRGEMVLGNTVDMPIQEYQEIFEMSAEAEIRRMVAIQKAYYGKKPSMFILPGDGKVVREDYIPDDTFATDQARVFYPLPGSDANGIAVAIGQKIGMGIMSTETGMELDPTIEDPAREKHRIIMDGLEKALLAGLEQQLTSGQMDSVMVAKIAMKLTDPEMTLADAITSAHQEAQNEQAAQAQAQQAQQAQQGQQDMGGQAGMSGGGMAGPGGPQGMPPSPEGMPGINQTPPATPQDQAQPQPSIAPPPQGAMDLKSLLGALGGK